MRPFEIAAILIRSGKDRVPTVAEGRPKSMFKPLMLLSKKHVRFSSRARKTKFDEDGFENPF